MAIQVWLKSALVVLGIASLAVAETPFTTAFIPSQSPAFSSNVIDVKTEPGTTTIESPEVRRLGNHTFVVGKLVTHSTLARGQVAGTRIWIPVSEVLEIIEHEKVEKPRPAGTTVNPISNSRVEVEWGGTWWSAEILEHKDNKYRIHYTGWSDTWDEWITADRIRVKKVEGDAAEAK